MKQTFDKSPRLFPVKNEFVYLTHCGVSAQYAPAAAATAEFSATHARRGAAVFQDYPDALTTLCAAGAELLHTDRSNVAFVKNTSEAINMIASGYPFEPGDRVISYTHEYPANHYPWLIQRDRGVDFVLLSDHDSREDALREDALRDNAAREDAARNRAAGPTGWSFAELEELANDRTRVIALSHVQFTSGFAADLPRLGAFCKERDIDLVIDAAQSLGGLPLLPEEWNIAAVAASGWKWLLGPLGTGLFYSAPAFRAKLRHTLVGAELMAQGLDYLDHTWNPLTDARRFHYSTAPYALAVGLERTIRDNFLRYGAELVRDENARLRAVFLDALDQERHRPLLWDNPNQSGILALRPGGDPEATRRALFERGIFVTERGGYLRIAPHFYNDDEEMLRAARALNDL